MEHRFWSKVRRGSPDECWEWLAYKNADGGGRFYHSGRLHLSHRVAWELTHGEIPVGLVVRHRCRGRCVNPAHLEVGTQAENMRDMVRDGTSTRGERDPTSRLTEEQVRTIKHRLREYEKGMVKMLAEEYGVTPQQISKIKAGRNWGWVD